MLDALDTTLRVSFSVQPPSSATKLENYSFTNNHFDDFFLMNF